jgi:hypothetical protein
VFTDPQAGGLADLPADPAEIRFALVRPAAATAVPPASPARPRALGRPRRLGRRLAQLLDQPGRPAATMVVAAGNGGLSGGSPKTGSPSPWTEELSPAARRLISQAADPARLPPRVGEPAAIGRMAEMNYLVRHAGTLSANRAEALSGVTADILQLIQYGTGSPQVQAALNRVEQAERFDQLIGSDDFTRRLRQLEQEYLRAGQADLRQQDAARAARAAAQVRAIAELAGRIAADGGLPPRQPGPPRRSGRSLSLRPASRMTVCRRASPAVSAKG